MTAYSYCRISRDRSDSVSIDAQSATAERYYHDHRESLGDPFVVVADRDVSGGVPLSRRPAAAKMWQALQSGDHVIVAKIDRAFRSMADGAQVIEDLHRRGVGLHLLDLRIDTTTPSGLAIAHVMIAFAEFERRRISERRRDAAKQRRAIGVPTCARHYQPLGWQIVRDEPDGPRRYAAWPEERRQCRQVLRWRDQGLTYDAIVDKTIERRWTNLRNGGRWNRARVRRALMAAREDFPLVSHDVRRWGAESGRVRPVAARIKSQTGGDDNEH